MFWGTYTRSSTKAWSTTWTASITLGIACTIWNVNCIADGASANVGISSIGVGNFNAQVTPNQDASNKRVYYYQVIGIL